MTNDEINLELEAIAELDCHPCNAPYLAIDDPCRTRVRVDGELTLDQLKRLTALMERLV